MAPNVCGICVYSWTFCGDVFVNVWRSLSFTDGHSGFGSPSINWTVSRYIRWYFVGQCRIRLLQFSENILIPMSVFFKLRTICIWFLKSLFFPLWKLWTLHASAYSPLRPPSSSLIGWDYARDWYCMTYFGNSPRNVSELVSVSVNSQSADPDSPKPVGSGTVQCILKWNQTA